MSPGSYKSKKTTGGRGVSDFARPARQIHPQITSALRRPRLLIVGCGDVGQRVVNLLKGRWRVRALATQPQSADRLRSLGVLPLLGDLDRPDGLKRLAGLASLVLHLAPPRNEGSVDSRTSALLRSLAGKNRRPRLVYASTTGVYGDTQGECFDETRPVAPSTLRAHRRVDAERELRRWGSALRARVSILRIPGIYALDRPGGDPRERLRRGMPVLTSADDVFTNHIHADDLARACMLALFRAAPQRVIHVSDDSRIKMGDHFDMVADLAGLPRPPRISRAQACDQLSPMQVSFLSESRRLDNRRLKRELRMQLRCPTVREAFLTANEARPATVTGS